MKLATLIYVHDTEQDKTLMLLRNKKENDVHEGKRNGLGGKFEEGESPDTCCIRELQEESGLTATEFELKGILTAPNFSHDHDRYIFIYKVTDWTGEIIESNEGELHRIDNNKLLDLNLREGDKKFLPLVFKPGLFHTTMRYKNKKLESREIKTTL